MTIRGTICISSLCIIIIFLLTTNLFAEKQQPGWWNYAQSKAQREGYRIITTDELKELYSRDADFIIIDSRYTYEYQDAHLPGAINVPFDISQTSNLSDDKKSELLKALGNDAEKTIITYCRNFR